MSDVNKTIWMYFDYLNNSLPQVKEFLGELKEYEECLGDWMQSTWETLVETKLFYGTSSSLPVYGDGADISKGSSRVCFPERLPSHKLKCVCARKITNLISGEYIELEKLNFEKFVKWENGWFSVDNDLNSILLSKGDEDYVVSINDIAFELVEV